MQNVQQHKLRLPQPRGHWMQLVCGVANYVQQLTAVANNLDRMMPLREDHVRHSIHIHTMISFSGLVRCVPMHSILLHNSSR
jgi:hypothetical protein